MGLGDIRKPSPLFHDFLLQRSLIMVGGEPYTGKTMLTLALALALDANKPLLGFEPQERQRVLYIGQDAPTWDYAEQTRKLLRGYDLDAKAIDALDADACFNEGYNLLDVEFMDFLRDWHKEVGCDVVVFDTLAALHSADENSNRDMNVVMNRLKYIRDFFGVTVIFTHHESKPNENARSAVYKARGASVISGSVDIYLSLQPASDGKVRLTMPKGRGISNHKRKVLYSMEDVGTPDAPGVRLVPQADNKAHAKHLSEVLSKEPSGSTLTRSELCVSLAKAFPELTPTLVGPATDNALLVLQRNQKAAKVGRGEWKLI